MTTHSLLSSSSLSLFLSKVTNVKLRMQIPLLLSSASTDGIGEEAPPCAITVDGVERSYEPGKAIVYAPLRRAIYASQWIT